MHVKKGCCSWDTTDPGVPSHLPIDRGWAWIIVVASVGIFAVNAGTYRCFGIIKLELTAAFPECNQDIPLWILSTASVISLFVGPIMSTVAARFSHRILGICGTMLLSLGLLLTAFAPNCYFFFFSFSFVYATGGGILLIVCMTAFAPYFLRRRALAAGVMASGSGVGGIVLPPLMTYLFEHYSFQQAITLYSGVCLHLLVFCCLLRPLSYYERPGSSPTEKTKKINDVPNSSEKVCLNSSINSEVRIDNQEKGLMKTTPNQEMKDDAASQKGKNICMFSIWRNPKVLVISILMFFSMNANCLFTTITPSYAEEHNVNTNVLSYIMAITGTAEIIFRVVNGWFADRKLTSALNIVSLVILLTGVAACLAASIPGIIGICILYTMYAVFGSSMFSLIPVVIIELAGVDNMTYVIGVTNVFQAFAFLASAPIGNSLYSVSKTWVYVMYYISVCYFVAASIGFFYHLVMKFPSKKIVLSEEKNESFV